MKRLSLLLPLLPFVLLSCSDAPGEGGSKRGSGGGHAHTSPRGGTLVEIGDHVAQVDLVLDPAAGELHAYVMDGHASRAVRIAQETLAVTVGEGTETFELPLAAAADPLSGETVGDTSHFSAVSERLKGRTTFSGRIGPIRVFGKDCEPVAFRYGGAGPG